MAASMKGSGPPTEPTEPVITLNPWEARLLWDVYHGDPNDRVRDPIQARAILDRARGEADAYFDAMMWWDTERRRARNEEHRRQLKSQDS